MPAAHRAPRARGALRVGLLLSIVVSAIACSGKRDERDAHGPSRPPQVVLRCEVVRDQALGHPGPGRDRSGAGPLVAAVGEDLHRGIDDVASGPLSLRCSAHASDLTGHLTSQVMSAMFHLSGVQRRPVPAWRAGSTRTATVEADLRSSGYAGQVLVADDLATVTIPAAVDE